MTRRPMLFAACGCAAAVMVSYYVGIAAAAGVFCAGVLLPGFLLKGRPEERRRAAAVVILIAYCCGLLSFWNMDRILTEQSAKMTEGSAYGEIVSCSTRTSQSGDSYLQMVVRTEKGRILGKVFNDCNTEGTAANGCMVSISGRLKDPQVRRNPGCFDYSLYLRSQGIVKTVTCDSVTVYPVRTFSEAPLAFVRNKVFTVREGFIERLALCTDPHTAALIRAIMFGDKGGLDEDVLTSFQKNGTAHILAVSGLHIGILYGFLLKLWRWRRGWTFLLFNTAFFLLYAAAAGFSPSVTRAVIMVLLHVAAVISGRRYDLANAAFIVFTGVVLHNPYMVFNAGFQMSFLAVLTISIITPYVGKVYSGLFMASLVVQAGLGPFMLYNFNYFSLIAVLINVPVVALAGIIVPAGLTAMVLSPFAVFDPVAGLLSPMCAALVRLNEVTQIDGITSFQVPSPPLWILAFYYLCLLMLASEEGRLHLLRAAHRGRYVLKVLLVITVVSACFSAFASDGFRDCNLTFVDVGQGDCVCVRVDGGLAGCDRCYLFDGGGSADYNVGRSILRQYLLKNGLSHVDAAFVTHLHTDHYKGVCELSHEGMVKQLYVYDANRLKQRQIMEDTGLAGDAIHYLGSGDTLELGSGSGLLIGLLKQDSVYLQVLYPDRRTEAEYGKMLDDETDENLLSLLFKVTFKGRTSDTSVLITGDLGEEGEAELARNSGTKQHLRSDILKVGHHGSKTSSSELFLAAVRPGIAVIQVGENNMYGHPTPEALQRLADAGAAIYRTDQMGAVGFTIRHGHVKEVKTMIED